MTNTGGSLIHRGKRRRTLGRRVRRELRSLKRWATVFVVLWGYFKLSGCPSDRVADASGKATRTRG